MRLRGGDAFAVVTRLARSWFAVGQLGLATLKSGQRPSHGDRCECEARRRVGNVGYTLRLKVPDDHQQNVSQREVEKAPENVDDRRREPSKRRRRERAEERAPRDPSNEVWDEVGQERAPEEERHNVVPGHRAQKVAHARQDGNDLLPSWPNDARC